MRRDFYATHERPGQGLLWLSTLQWFVFTLASVITVPVVLGPAFGLNAAETALFTDRTLFVCGVIGLLQALLGHRFPIIEGPAGMWWGVWLVLVQMTRDAGGSPRELLQDLALGMFVAALLYILLSLFGLVERVRRWFTPIVSGTFMVLLSLQLSKSLVTGTLGINQSPTHRVQLPILVLSVGLIGITVWLMYKGKGMLKSLAVLIGLALGWGVYVVSGQIHMPPATTRDVFQWPQVLPFGPPTFHLGVVLTCIFTALILLTNLITSIQVMSDASREPTNAGTFRRGTLTSGIGTALGGLFGAVGCVPLATSGSLVALTGIASRLPFVLSSAFLVVISLFPSVGRLIATLPEPVGYAVLFTVFGQLLGVGLRDFKQVSLNQRDLFVISLSVLTGVGMFFVPAESWAGLPPVVGFLLDNGLIIGIGMVLVLEHVVFRKRKTEEAKPV